MVFLVLGGRGGGGPGDYLVPGASGSSGMPAFLNVSFTTPPKEAYQAAASGRVSPCRFYPSCSQYAVEAFTDHGFWRGLARTARRLESAA